MLVYYYEEPYLCYSDKLNSCIFDGSVDESLFAVAWYKVLFDGDSVCLVSDVYTTSGSPEQLS
jgi:hypothetical protein